MGRARRCGLVMALMALVAAVLVAPVTAEAASTEAMYRLYNQWSGEHLFTTDRAEYDSLDGIGWTKEGVAWWAPTTGDVVYRLYNRWSGDHFYTGSKQEYDQLGSIGWTQEGVAFHSDTAKGVPIYRLFNPWLTAGTHLFTTDKSEYDSLQIPGWQGEGVAFYGAKLHRNSHYAVFNNVASTWDEAETYCESLGGHLATIGSQEENDTVYQVVRDAGYRSAYIGLSDEAEEGTWVWVTGEAVTYTNWHAGEPNNEYGTEDYAMFYYKWDDGTWNDGAFKNGRTDSDVRAFVCEWDTDEAYQAYLDSITS